MASDDDHLGPFEESRLAFQHDGIDRQVRAKLHQTRHIGDDEEVAATVRDEGPKPASDGLESDAEGCIYATAYENNAIVRRRPDGQFEPLVHDARLLWPDTMSLADDGFLYFTANQLHRQARFHGGKDLRKKPYSLFRIRVDAKPVALK